MIMCGAFFINSKEGHMARIERQEEKYDKKIIILFAKENLKLIKFQFN